MFASTTRVLPFVLLCGTLLQLTIIPNVSAFSGKGDEVAGWNGNCECCSQCSQSGAEISDTKLHLKVESKHINECNTNPCVNGKYNCSCSCPPGWTGPLCETNINECESSPCVNGQCTDMVNGYICHCQPGWTGKRCVDNINECVSSLCVNGQCEDKVNGYTCHCEVGWMGQHCDDKINECEPNPCVNGQCVELVNANICQCQAGWTGTHCDDRSRNCRCSDEWKFSPEIEMCVLDRCNINGMAYWQNFTTSENTCRELGGSLLLNGAFVTSTHNAEKRVCWAGKVDDQCEAVFANSNHVIANTKSCTDYAGYLCSKQCS